MKMSRNKRRRLKRTQRWMRADKRMSGLISRAEFDAQRSAEFCDAVEDCLRIEATDVEIITPYCGGDH